MGVDGFREDVITFISKKEGLPNGFPLPVATGIEHYANGPHTYEYLKEFKDDVLSKYDCFIVGESPLVNIKRALKYTTEGDGQVLQMMFSFDHMCADCFMVDYIPRPFNLKKMKKSFSKWQNTINGIGWNSLYIENHDHPRIISRYGSEKYHDESGKTLAAMYMLQQGTPYIYQGQEIGMTNIKFDSIDQCKDVASHNAYNTYKNLHFSEKTAMNAVCKGSRENARTPVQWDDSENAGFTTGTPWFIINDNYKEINVSKQENDENSLLNFYRKLIISEKKISVCCVTEFIMNCLKAVPISTSMKESTMTKNCSLLLTSKKNPASLKHRKIMTSKKVNLCFITMKKTLLITILSQQDLTN